MVDTLEDVNGHLTADNTRYDMYDQPGIPEMNVNKTAYVTNGWYTARFILYTSIDSGPGTPSLQCPTITWGMGVWVVNKKGAGSAFLISIQ